MTSCDFQTQLCNYSVCPVSSPSSARGFTLQRITVSPASVCAVFTGSSHPALRRTGHADSETSFAAMRGQHGIDRRSRMDDSVSDNTSRCPDRFETETDLFAAAPLRGCSRNRCSNNRRFRINPRIRRNRTTIKSPIPGRQPLAPSVNCSAADPLS